MLSTVRNLLCTLVGVLSLCLPANAMPTVPAHIDHEPFDLLLRTYVDDRGLVDYAGWHASAEDGARLKSYLAQFAPVTTDAAKGPEWVASLVNAYNAFTIDFILDHFPIESIRLLNDPFTGKRNNVGGKLISVDFIEHDMLRPIIGWKVHSMVVCAARSCSPLLNRAYRADDWEKTMEERYRTWLARADLNHYQPGRKRATVSKIFDWYSADFTGEHSVMAILARFGPTAHRDFLQSEDYRISFMNYHWGLNAQSDLGQNYRHSWLRSLF